MVGGALHARRRGLRSLRGSVRILYRLGRRRRREANEQAPILQRTARIGGDSQRGAESQKEGVARTEIGKKADSSGSERKPFLTRGFPCFFGLLSNRTTEQPSCIKISTGAHTRACDRRFLCKTVVRLLSGGPKSGRKAAEAAEQQPNSNRTSNRQGGIFFAVFPDRKGPFHGRFTPLRQIPPCVKDWCHSRLSGISGEGCTPDRLHVEQGLRRACPTEGAEPVDRAPVERSHGPDRLSLRRAYLLCETPESSAPLCAFCAFCATLFALRTPESNTPDRAAYGVRMAPIRYMGGSGAGGGVGNFPQNAYLDSV